MPAIMSLSPTLISCLLLAQAAKEPSIQVVGAATIEVAPDRMVWSVTLSNRGNDLEQIANEHTALVERAKQVLRDLQIPAQDTKVTDMRFGAEWDQQAGQRARVGYVATTYLVVTSSDLARYQSLWKGLAKVPGVSVEQVAFDHSRRIQFQEDARLQAAKAARTKAQLLAGALDSTIAEPLAIEEREDSGYPQSLTIASNAYVPIPNDAPEPPMAGKLRIQAKVQVTFRLKPKGGGPNAGQILSRKPLRMIAVNLPMENASPERQRRELASMTPPKTSQAWSHNIP